MTFRYGLGESRFLEIKHHADEKQWSPLVFYDPARCILCYRCIRVCDEGLGVGALGLSYRGVSAEIIPNRGDHLECDECGWCIDVCPVGALTSGTYRYRSRPWEMNYVPAVCTHCSNGCKTTLSVRNGEIIRANNRDRSGINGEFLCVKGRFAWDFVHSGERLRTPLMRKDGRLEPVKLERGIESRRRAHPRLDRAQRQGRRHWLNPHHQRRKLLPAEVRPPRAAHQQHRSSPHGRSRHASSGCLEAVEGALATVNDLYTPATRRSSSALILRSSIRCWLFNFAPTGAIIIRLCSSSARAGARGPVRGAKHPCRRRCGG